VFTIGIETADEGAALLIISRSSHATVSVDALGVKRVALSCQTSVNS